VPEEAKGKDDMSMTTCQGSNRRFVQISRHRYPIVPRSTQGRRTNRSGGRAYGSDGRSVWVAGAPNDTEVGVGGCGVEQGKVSEGVESP
jgi:hypothetical protein